MIMVGEVKSWNRILRESQGTEYRQQEKIK